MRPSRALAAGLSVGALLLAALPGRARAQSVRAVVDTAAGAVPPDLTAALLTEGGERVAPRLVPRSGRVELRAPAPGTYRVALYRVGYGRVVSAPVALAADGAVPVVRLRPPLAHVTLAPVAVTGRTVCGRRPDAGAAALLWEEVRKALDATALAMDAGLLDAATAEYWRETTPRDGRVLRERRVEGWTRVRTPYVTRPPAELLAQGFARAWADTLEAYAPDAHLLLDPAFHAAYCFGVRTDGAPEPGLVGLTFAPATSGGAAAVRGVLWVDRATAELRTLRFDYVGMPGRWATLAGPLAAAGGEVDYTRLPSGLWVVRAWRLRLPRPSARPVDRLATFPRHTVEGVWEVGGELVDAERLDGDGTPNAPPNAPPNGPPGAAPSARLAALRRSGPVEVVTVSASVRVTGAGGRPLAGALVAVDSGAALPADSAGRVLLARLLVGERRLRVDAPGHAPFDSVLAVPAIPDFTLAVTLDSAAPGGDAGGVRAAVDAMAGAARDSAQAAAARRVAVLRAGPLAGFERRRRSRLGTYLTRTDIERRRARTMPDVFRGLLGVLVDGRGVRMVRPGFGVQAGSAEEVACFPTVFVDNNRTSLGADPFGALVPEDLEGVEVYRGVGATPPEFAGSGGTTVAASCGVIALWTRRAAGTEGGA